jgi:hypothetical protein
MTDLPKGFYAGPDGKQRFWDGEEWHESAELPANDAAPKKPRHWTREKKLATAGVSLVVIVALAVGGVAIWQQQMAEIAAVEDIRVLELAEAEAAAAAENVRLAAEAEELRDTERRQQNRREAITEIQADVESMARGHVADGIITGQVISTACTTTGGIALDDISIRSMLFECFVATEDNGDGTQNGFYYHARANWDTGSWTFGLGGE